MNGGKVSGIALRRELMAFAKARQKREDRIADQITAFAGSLQFVYIHVAWFTAWIIINVSPWAFDPYPFGLLTLIVSLEAIFLSTFVMLSQNRESARSDCDPRSTSRPTCCPRSGWRRSPTTSAST